MDEVSESRSGSSCQVNSLANPVRQTCRFVTNYQCHLVLSCCRQKEVRLGMGKEGSETAPRERHRADRVEALHQSSSTTSRAQLMKVCSKHDRRKRSSKSRSSSEQGK